MHYLLYFDHHCLHYKKREELLKVIAYLGLRIKVMVSENGLTNFYFNFTNCFHSQTVKCMSLLSFILYV